MDAPPSTALADDTMDAAMMTDDRRFAPRLSVDLWVEERSDDAIYFQRATNLSLGGLFLDRTLPHAAGTVIALDLRLGTEGPALRLRGEVVPAPSRELGMGVRFLDLSASDRARLEQWLEQKH